MPQQAQIRLLGKLKPYQVLYMEDGGPKRCDRCVMWVKDAKRCTIIGPNIEVRGDMVCCMYIYGPPATSDQVEPRALVDAQEVGLGKGDTSCGNCRYGDGSPTCMHPALESFNIDNEGGCCNAWTPKPGEPSRD